MPDDVLLVEDDEDIRENLAFLIEAQGFSVETAADGREALNSLRSAQLPCLIILDLMMPVMDGWSLRSELLKDPSLAEIPVVLLSGIADVQKEARSLQAVDYLTKPVDLDKVYRLVACHC